MVMATSDAWFPFLKSRLGFSDSSYIPRPTGTIIITGVKINGEGVESLPQNYAWDLTNPTSGWERLGNISRGVVYSAFIEPTNLYRPHSAFLRVFAVDPQDKSLQEWVARADLASGQASFLAIDMSENPKLLTWSESAQLLAYQGEERRSDADGLRNVVKVYDPKKEEVILTLADARQPLWLPDGTKLLYLRDSGVYYYDLGQKREVSVMTVKDYDPEKRYIDENAKIGLSAEGRYLAWTSPSEQALYVFEIKNWDPIELETVQIVKDSSAHFYWPVFSPDSRLVSVQAISVDPATGFRIDPQLRVYALGSLEPIVEVPLSSFDFDQLFTDTWVGVSSSEFNLDSYFTKLWSVVKPSILQPKSDTN